MSGDASIAGERLAAQGIGQGTEEGGSEGERLQRLLARAGYGSRRACEELIGAGRVSVNGKRSALGARAVPGRDEVRVDGTVVALDPTRVYYLCNKPAGVVTSARHQDRRPVVLDLVPRTPKVFPVGRLDAATEGLILLTNDGDLAQRLTHPSYGIEKEYLVSVEGALAQRDIAALRRGVVLEDGMTAPARVSLVGPSLLRITVHEGRTHLVRRMCSAVGHPVERLVRIRIGPLRDPRLLPGHWRALTPTELRRVQEATARLQDATARRTLRGGSGRDRGRHLGGGGNARASRAPEPAPDPRPG